jgi:adenylosuccinate synthase
MLSVRTFPIRVGNVPDGYSGDCYPDQVETTWETLGVEPEITTVTKRVRRVFTFSDLQYAEAVSVNRPTHVFLNFCNYLRNFDRLMELLERMVAAEKAARGSNTDLRRYFGFGPTLSDIVSTVGGAEKMYERVKNG